jgi:hypothetical protein
MRVNCTRGLVGLAVLLPALAAAQDTTYDYDKTAPFAQYRTYAFKEGTSTGDRLVDARIVAAIESELARRGLAKAAGTPDVYVVFHMAYDKQKDISTFSTGPYGGYGWGWGWGWGSTTTDVRVREILIGTLAIDVADATRQQVVWRGLGTKQVDTDADPEKRDKAIAKAVAKIMKHYPPGADE